MSTRTRILLAALVAAVLPLVLLTLGARSAIRDRFAEQYHGSVAAAATTLEDRLLSSASVHDGRLRAVASALQNDPRTRAALTGAAESTPLLDFAPSVMESAGFDYLVLLDSRGVVFSAGHYRNDYGRQADALLTLARTESTGVVRARRPTDTFLVLARAHRFMVQMRVYTLVAGTGIDSVFMRDLTPGDGAPLLLTLRLPDVTLGPVADGGSPAHERITMPFIDVDENRVQPDGAEWIISYTTAPLDALLAAIDRWFLAALGAALLLAFIIAQLLAARVNRPLEELTRKASRVGLERYDVRFTTRRRDEIGSLSRVLDGMVQRLRAGALQLRDAERRATIGDMARQVNHDIRNGLLPIRNVIGHLGEVAAESPEELADVFGERRQTLQNGIAYLESLATSYARLSPRLERQQCSVNDIVQTITGDAAAARRVVTELTSTDPHVDADPVALRRIIENLVINAAESLPDGGGTVTVRTARRNDTVTIDVIDDGAGMTPDVVEHIFDDFYTTKERGTGLGLSIVRRLVADMGGRVSVASEPGRGTTFTIELPAA